MANGEAKELMCMNDGHELKWGNDDGKGVTRQRGKKGKK